MGFWKDFAFSNAIFAKDEVDFLANSLIYVNEAEREEREKEEKRRRKEEKRNRIAQDSDDEDDTWGAIAILIIAVIYLIWQSIIGIINFVVLLFDIITKVGRKEKKFNIKKYRWATIIIAIITISITTYIIISIKK